jgi:hypothetical protein
MRVAKHAFAGSASCCSPNAHEPREPFGSLQIGPDCVKQRVREICITARGSGDHGYRGCEEWLTACILSLCAIDARTPFSSLAHRLLSEDLVTCYRSHVRLVCKLHAMLLCGRLSTHSKPQGQAQGTWIPVCHSRAETAQRPPQGCRQNRQRWPSLSCEPAGWVGLRGMDVVFRGISWYFVALNDDTWMPWTVVVCPSRVPLASWRGVRGRGGYILYVIWGRGL